MKESFNNTLGRLGYADTTLFSLSLLRVYCGRRDLPLRRFLQSLGGRGVREEARGGTGAWLNSNWCIFPPKIPPPDALRALVF